ncbi:MarR family winged helix-turn-helix transcriptional regulator [Parvibaculum sp.]|uniref:MarR family winged helix-turn-helix transcriptional regulator n=1 Tax=Parvibaculum sp. TaxID=2024848 RepID=UPI0025D99056|nr:MarR family winged helix-turn-helix transcriptional regulator [Parvibaculum sp.]
MAGNQQDTEERQFGWTLHDVFRLFQRAWHRRLRESGSGISPAQSRVLTELYRQGGLTQTALADEIGMEKAPLGRLLDRMEEQGFVERKPDPDDRRVRLVYPTAKSDSLDEPMWGAARGMFEMALDGLSAKERATLISLLERLKQNLSAEEARAIGPRRTAADDEASMGE